MNRVAAEPRITIRALKPDDLDAVVAIDRAIEKRPRRAYVQRRLQAALSEPARHAQFAATDADGLIGYLLARVLRGEFGRRRPALRIELVGVRADLQGQGVGRLMLDALSGYARRKGLVELRTSADWRDHRMLRWFDATGFVLASDRIVECPVLDGAYRPERDDVSQPPVGSHSEIDYGAPSANDFEKMARDTADVRSMSASDLADIVRIDRALTGVDRSEYIGAQFSESMADSAIRVSLVARVDGVAAGYLMARSDLGDFGRTEPVAVIDTIGVDPAFAHRGIGHALLSQLFANLGALRVERVETIVAPSDIALAGFLAGCGFLHSQRLAFERTVG
ncbi:MAG: GNAT family N-acetyltransferase [Burkholderiaceae bacterium]